MKDAPTNGELLGMIDALRNTLLIVLKEMPELREKLENRRIVPNPGAEMDERTGAYLEMMQSIREALRQR